MGKLLKFFFSIFVPDFVSKHDLSVVYTFFLKVIEVPVEDFSNNPSFSNPIISATCNPLVVVEYACNFLHTTPAENRKNMRGRGRPPKAKTEIIPKVLQVKRGRGRPRKQL